MHRLVLCTRKWKEGRKKRAWRMATHMCYVWSVSVCLWSSNHAQSALSTPRMRAIPIPRFWIMSIRVTLFPLFSWFIIKTGKLKWILTSEAQSCLFFFLFFFFLLFCQPLQLLWNSILGSTAATANLLLPGITGDDLTWGEQFTLTHTEIERCCSFN